MLGLKVLYLYGNINRYIHAFLTYFPNFWPIDLILLHCFLLVMWKSFPIFCNICTYLCFSFQFSLIGKKIAGTSQAADHGRWKGIQ